VDDIDDGGLRGLVDLADEILRTFGGDRQPVEVAGAAIDDSAGATRGLLLLAQGNELVSLEIATPSLEDVFIELTGRRLRD